jgi:hypothetical protein
MNAIAILPLLMLVLLGLGTLAGIVYLTVHTVAKMPRGAAQTALAVPLGVIVTLGLVTLVGALWNSNQQRSTLGEAAMDHASAIPITVSPDNKLVVVATAALGLFAIIAALRMRRPRPDGQRRIGWAIPLLLAFLIGPVFVMWLSHEPEPFIVAPPQVHAMTEIESARWHVEEAQRELELAGKKAGDEVRQTMQELYEQVNQPRIPVDPAVDVAVVATADTESHASSTGDDHLGEGDDDSGLVHQAERVARLARLLATVATEVSDVATAVGRGLVTTEDAAENEPTAEAENLDNDDLTPPAESVALTEHVEPTESAPAKPRPAWVDDPPKRIGDTWREVIVAGQYATVDECTQAADLYMLMATFQHLQQITGDAPLVDRSRPDLIIDNGNISAGRKLLIVNGRPMDHQLLALTSAGIGIDFIRREIAKEEYLETVERSFGEMKTLYTRLEFTPAVDRELRMRWDAYRRDERFFIVGAAAGGVLSLLGLTFGLLKVDALTKGYYTKRLFLGVPAAIIGVVVLLMTFDTLMHAIF